MRLSQIFEMQAPVDPQSGLLVAGFNECTEGLFSGWGGKRAEPSPHVSLQPNAMQCNATAVVVEIAADNSVRERLTCYLLSVSHCPRPLLDYDPSTLGYSPRKLGVRTGSASYCERGSIRQPPFVHMMPKLDFGEGQVSRRPLMVVDLCTRQNYLPRRIRLFQILARKPIPSRMVTAWSLVLAS